MRLDMRLMTLYSGGIWAGKGKPWIHGDYVPWIHHIWHMPRSEDVQTINIKTNGGIPGTPITRDLSDQESFSYSFVFSGYDEKWRITTWKSMKQKLVEPRHWLARKAMYTGFPDGKSVWFLLELFRLDTGSSADAYFKLGNDAVLKAAIGGQGPAGIAVEPEKLDGKGGCDTGAGQIWVACDERLLYNLSPFFLQKQHSPRKSAICCQGSQSGRIADVKQSFPLSVWTSGIRSTSKTAGIMWAQLE